MVSESYDAYLAVEAFAHAAAAIKHRAALEIVDARRLTRHGLDRFHPLPADDDNSGLPAFDIAAPQRNGQSPHPRTSTLPSWCSV